MCSPKFCEAVEYRGRWYQFIGTLGSNMMGERLCVIRNRTSGRLLGPMPIGWVRVGEMRNPGKP